MWIPLSTSGLVTLGQYSLPCIYLGSVLASAIALPINHESLQTHGVEKSQSLIARAGFPIKPKPPVHLDPNPAPPIRLNDPVDPTIPPPIRPNSPHDPAPPPLAQPKANPNPDPAGPIPTEAEIQTLCSVPPDKAIFWSGTGDKVHDYKIQDGLISDSQAYPPGYSWTFRDTDPVKYNEFAYRFSRVFARTAKGEVRLMVPWEAGPNPTATFHTDEWPILKEGLATGRITKIIQVNPNNWQETRIYDPTTYGLTKRAAPIDVNNIPWDVNLDALAEVWKRANDE